MPVLFDEVPCRLAADPARRHIRDFRGGYEAVHIFVQIDGSLVPVYRDTLLDLHHLAEDVARQPFQRFLGTGRTAHHVTHRRDDFLHTHFPVIRFELRQFLEAERHAHLVASCRADQAVYLVEVQRRQLVHDNAHGDILPCPVFTRVTGGSG